MENLLKILAVTCVSLPALLVANAYSPAQTKECGGGLPDLAQANIVLEIPSGCIIRG